MRTWNELFIGLDGPNSGGVATSTADPSGAAGDVTTGAADGSDRGGSRWFSRFRDSLSKSRTAMAQQIATVAFDPADAGVWERIEEGLIAADCGVPTTVAVVAQLETEAAAGRLRTGAELSAALRRIAAELMTTEVSDRIDIGHQPAVILMVGVNGTGKTTTCGKLAARLAQHDRSVLIGAADTFRAAAAEQLQVWADRADARFVRTKEGGDPAAVAFESIETAVEHGTNVVLIDTAGRLHTKTNLMEELAKVRRVVGKKLDGAPHETLLTIDATTGQNGMRQAREFAASVDVTGIVLTKLDGSAKGGIGLAIANELGIPIKLVGVGESLDDLQPFDVDDYLNALFPDDLLQSATS